MSRLSRELTEKLSPPQTRQQRHLETLIQVSAAIGSILDQRQLITAIAKHVTAAFQTDRTTLFLHDESADELWSLVAEGIEDDGRGVSELRISADQGLCGRAFRTHELLCIADTFDEPEFAREVAESTGYVPRSMLIVPVVYRPGACAGVIQVLDQRVGYFCDDDLTLLEAIAVQVGISLDNARLYEAQQRQFQSFVTAMSTALDARDPLTQLHSANVANYAVGIAVKLGLPDQTCRRLHVAGLLHDIGKIGVPEHVLTKPGRLTDEEFEQMRRHAEQSLNILSRIEFTEDLQDIPTIAAAHHERLDGTGYPHGLTADQLPVEARILAVADVFDALTQDRHYRAGMSHEKAFAIIDGLVPEQLDADCVQALKQFVGRR